MTSSFIAPYAPPWAEKSQSHDFLRQQAAASDQAVLDSLDDDEEFRKQQQAQAAEIQRQEAAQREQNQQQAVQAAEQLSPPNPIQEVGTAVVGAGIDAVESIGATAQAGLTGQMTNPNFKPTWLQVSDEQEPMNRTVWGKLLRGVGEYAVLTGLLRGAAKGAKAVRVPGANRLSQALATDAAMSTKQRLVRDATKGAIIGAAADFTSSYSQGETLSTEANKLMPWLPDWLVTNENDTPLERRAKNVIEGLGMGAVTDVLFGWRAARKAAQAAEVPPETSLKALQDTEVTLNDVQQKLAAKVMQVNPDGKLTADQISFLRETDPEFNALEQARKDLNKQYKEIHDSMDPKAIAEAKIKDSADRRQANFDEKVRTALADDPEGLEPNAWVNAPIFDRPDKGLFSPAGEGGYFKSLLNSYRMANDGILTNGRRPSVYTEAALEKRLSQFDPERRKVIEQIAKGLEVELNQNAVAAGPMAGFDVEQLKALSTAKYLDLLDDIAKNPEDLEPLRERLLNNSDDYLERMNLITGKKERFLGLTDHRAVEMLINTTAGELSDLAQAGRSIDGVLSNDRQVEGLLKRMEFMLMETGRAKYVRGFELNGLKADPAVFQSGIRQREEDVKKFVTGLKDLFDNDPEMMRHYLDVLSLADGNVKAIDEMYKFAKDQVFNWQSVFGFGSENKRSAFMDALTSIMYNSVLSGPKTVMRAVMGNALTIYMRPVTTVLGGAITGDAKAMAMGLATMKTAFQSIDESWQIAKKAWIAGKDNIQDVPFLTTQRVPLTMTDQWKNVGAVIEKQGTTAEKAMYRLTSTLYDFNNWIGVKYPMVSMNAIDAATSVTMARMDAKIQAFGKAWDETGGKDMKALVQKYEQEFVDQIFDHKKQMIRSDYATRLADEAGLKLPISMEAVQRAEDLFQRVPLLRSNFMFMKTGWNALELVQKHTPILSRFNKEVQTVLSATADNLDNVAAYGITNPAQLLEAQATMRGRIAAGYLTVGSAISLYFAGGLTGNGPADRETRNAWTQAGWRPRSLKLGDQWISYDSLEPFTSFLATVADVGDNANLLGETAVQNWHTKLGYLIAMNVTNKSFLAGIANLNEILTLDANRSAIWASNLVNNQLPWAGIRNELANVFTPGMRELDRDFTQGLNIIANRNPLLKAQLPAKFDILDGSVVREFDPLTRVFNAISPLQVNFKDNETRRLLRESGYDLVTTLAYDSKGNKLDAKTRSRYQNLIGQQNIEAQLEVLFQDPAIRSEMETFQKIRDLGIRNASGDGGDREKGIDVNDAMFYRRIKDIFTTAKKKAEAQLYQEYPDLRHAAMNRRATEVLVKQNKTDVALQRLLSMPK